MEPLNFPHYQFEIQEAEGRQVIFDNLRKKWLQLLPEEWVRQHVVQYLVQEKQVPAGLIGVEKGFQFQGMQRRADLIVHDRQGAPVLMVECKAPAVKITQDVFDQVARYNMVIHAEYLFVTNGLQHYCCKIEADTRQYSFLKELPVFSAL
ncbi:MAG: type I restriction enzyme HsdR N-terminal domain-containing protein [Bacteroidota bacterium]